MKTHCKCFLPTLIVFAILTVPALSSAETVVVDFEDDFGPVQIPDGYGGIASWGGTQNPNDFWVILGSDENYPAHSGVCTAYQFGLGVPILFGADYVFVGAWMSGPSLPWETLFYELYLDGTLVHTSEEFVIISESVWCPSGYSDPVDEVRVWQNAGFSIFVMDDFTYPPSGTPVESTSWSRVKSLYR